MHRDDSAALIALAATLAAIVVLASISAWSAVDTAAQWIMAIFSSVSAITSLIALLLIRRTFMETKKTAQAAIEANEIARSEHRPWIKVTLDIMGAEIESYTEDSGEVVPRAHLYFKPILENIGNRVAVNAVCHLVTGPADLRSFVEDRLSDAFLANFYQTPKGYTIFPNDTYKEPGRNGVRVDPHLDILQGIAIGGVATYRGSADGEWRFTPFQFYIGFYVGNDGSLVITEEHSSFNALQPPT